MCDPCCLPSCCPSPCDPCCPEPICCPMPSCCPSPCDPCQPSCCPPSCNPCCPPPCCPPKRCKSRELVASVLMTKCECTQRNGLQLDCPRTECRGRPLCSIPMCCPSKFNYRFSNVTMGKPAFAVPAKKKKSCTKSNVCSPPSCDPCCKSC